ncbi:MAG TPA: UbiD family decarboxylase [Candidatus Binatia bacterium]|jgi:4-hydroxy-3-polyprenylbenzoate decarboxylase
MYTDLRDFLRIIEEKGDLQRVNGADPNVELGTIAELMAERAGPALLFDEIKGYRPGYRVAVNVTTPPRRNAVMLGLNPDQSLLGLVSGWRSRLKTFAPIAPAEVRQGPILANVMLGEKVDLSRFPAPLWRDRDGGPYIGTGCCVITRDPESGWCNLGSYRVQLHEPNLVGCYMSPGRHGLLLMEKYWNKGENAPVAVSLGHDPSLLFWAGSHVPHFGESEYGAAGWMKGRPVSVLPGPVTGIPIPAEAELVIEGEVPPPSKVMREEGTYGEWTGYYGHPRAPEPVIQVKSVLFRDDPINFGALPPYSMSKPSITGSAELWDALERAGFPDIRGVWIPTHGKGLVIVAIKQRYGSHARQVGAFVASTIYMGRFVVVVDDDIDVTNLDEVFWAVGSRCDPVTDIGLIDGMRSSALDPRLSPEKRQKRDFTNSIAVINACRPFPWRDSFPVVNKVREDIRETVEKKWADLFRSFKAE